MRKERKKGKDRKKRRSPRDIEKEKKLTIPCVDAHVTASATSEASSTSSHANGSSQLDAAWMLGERQEEAIVFSAGFVADDSVGDRRCGWSLVLVFLPTEEAHPPMPAAAAAIGTLDCALTDLGALLRFNAPLGRIVFLSFFFHTRSLKAKESSVLIHFFLCLWICFLPSVQSLVLNSGAPSGKGISNGGLFFPFFLTAQTAQTARRSVERLVRGALEAVVPRETRR